MNVSAALVTRGDHDLSPIHHELTEAMIAGLIDEVVVYNNLTEFHGDKAVYGRYIAAHKARNSLILAQDDDCILPVDSIRALLAAHEPRHVVCNMPQRFREQSFYASGEHALVGFGCVFERDLPQRAFDCWYGTKIGESKNGEWGMFRNTCDIVFTALTPRVLVDVPYENLPWATDETRMYRQNGHQGERQKMLDLVRQVRDA